MWGKGYFVENGLLNWSSEYLFYVNCTTVHYQFSVSFFFFPFFKKENRELKDFWQTNRSLLYFYNPLFFLYLIQLQRFLVQWFSSVSMLQNPLEGLVKHRFWPLPQSCWSSSSGVGPKNLKFQEDADVTDVGTILWKLTFLDPIFQRKYIFLHSFSSIYIIFKFHTLRTNTTDVRCSVAYNSTGRGGSAWGSKWDAEGLLTPPWTELTCYRKNTYPRHIQTESWARNTCYSIHHIIIKHFSHNYITIQGDQFSFNNLWV